MPKAEKVSWKESRADGLSGTTYSGLRLELDQGPVLVSKLSHGLRVLLILDPEKYHFIGEASLVEVSNALVVETTLALKADLRFQKECTDEYSRLMS